MTSEKPTPTATSVESDGSKFDLSAGLSELGDDPELLRSVMEAALEECAEHMQSVRSAIEAGDCQALMKSAHTLKGIIQYFGETRGYHQALELEQLGRDGILDGAASKVTELKAFVEELTVALTDWLQRTTPKDSA